MKKLITLFTISLLIVNTKGQFLDPTFLYSVELENALRLSQTVPGGTARATAMSGAWGALGGDFYSASLNPAGMGVYRSSEFVFTPEIYHNTSKTRYFGTEKEDDVYNINLNNAAYVANWGDESWNDLKGITFSVGYNKLNNFTENSIVHGKEIGKTLLHKVDYEFQDLTYPLDDMFHWLFYDAGIMVQDTSTGKYYVNEYYSDPVNQVRTIERSGKTNDWNVSLGLNFNHWIYLGASFGIVQSYFKEETIHEEYNVYGREIAQDFAYKEVYDMHSTGYNAKLGIILKPMNLIRIGLAYHTPTFYRANQDFKTSLYEPFHNTVYYPVDGNGYTIEKYEYEYTIRTPQKFIASAAVNLFNSWLISGDLEYIDYSTIKMDDEYDSDQGINNANEFIEEYMQAAINIRLGTELRLGGFRLRGGAAYMDGPYGSELKNNQTFRFQYSGGFGYRTEYFYVDFAQVFSISDRQEILYDAYDVGTDTYFANEANFDYLTSKTMITLGFRF